MDNSELFASLNTDKEGVAKAKEKYTYVQDLFFDVFTSPRGTELLKHLESRTINREFKIPPPRTADDLINFLTQYGVRWGQNDIINQIKSQVEQAKQRKSTAFKPKTE